MRKFYIEYKFNSNKDELSESEKAQENSEAALLMLSHLSAIFYFLGLTQFELSRFRAAKEGEDFSFDDFELALESIGELGQKIADKCYGNASEAFIYYRKVESANRR